MKKIVLLFVLSVTCLTSCTHLAGDGKELVWILPGDEKVATERYNFMISLFYAVPDHLLYKYAEIKTENLNSGKKLVTGLRIDTKKIEDQPSDILQFFEQNRIWDKVKIFLEMPGDISSLDNRIGYSEFHDFILNVLIEKLKRDFENQDWVSVENNTFIMTLLAKGWIDSESMFSEGRGKNMHLYLFPIIPYFKYVLYNLVPLCKEGNIPERITENIRRKLQDGKVEMELSLKNKLSKMEADKQSDLKRTSSVFYSAVDFNVLVLAILSYQKKHENKFPDSLDLLTPEYLKNIPAFDEALHFEFSPDKSTASIKILNYTYSYNANLVFGKQTKSRNHGK